MHARSPPCRGNTGGEQKGTRPVAGAGGHGTAAEKIKAQGAVEVLSLVYGVVDRLSADPAKLPYTESKETLPQPATPRSSGYGPYFGSVPDFRDDLKGVLFSAVQNNSPAARAGLKPGDLLVEFDGKPIQNLQDYAYALRAKQPEELRCESLSLEEIFVSSKILTQANP